MPLDLAVDLSSITDLRLIDAESGLRKMVGDRLAVGFPIDDIEALHGRVASEMRSRSLVYEPLSVVKAKHPAPAPDANADTDEEDEGDDGDEGPTDAEAKAQKAAAAGADPHVFVPVRNICRHCKRGAEDHVAKTLGTDGSMFKALVPIDQAKRQEMAEQGISLPDGSMPIPDEAHLHAMIRLVGQAPDPATAMNHIIERARTMGMEHALPPAWQVDTANPAPAAPTIGPGAHATPGPAAPGAAPGKPAAGPGPNPGQPPQAVGAPGAPAPAPGAAAAASHANADNEPSGPTTAPAGSAADGDDEDEPAVTNPAAKPGVMKRFANAIAKATGAQFDERTFIETLSANLDPDFAYAVVKATDEERYTLGPIYMPNTYDAHGEWTSAEDLQKAVWDYVADTGADRTVYLQHSAQPAGEWVEVMTWPHEVRAVMNKSINGVTKAEETIFPAGTAYMGVLWQPWAWEDVKKGKITGFSMGGSARRLEAEIAA